MEYTGERVIPKIMNPKNGLLMEHIERYEFAKKFARKRVLDIACGCGYGSEVLLNNNSYIDELVGIDISEESIEYAKKNYGFDNTNYYCDDALNVNLHKKYGTFDTIVSLETIEHFKGDYVFVNNLYNLLKTDGLLIVSTPFGRGKDFPCSNPFHVYQYTEEEFVDVLSPFNSITMYKQIDNTIELPVEGKKYYLMIALCKK